MVTCDTQFIALNPNVHAYCGFSQDLNNLITIVIAFNGGIYRSDIPVLWLRVDPYFAWIRQASTEQPDTTWCMMLKHERDSNAQIMVSH